MILKYRSGAKKFFGSDRSTSDQEDDVLIKNISNIAAGLQFSLFLVPVPFEIQSRKIF